MTEPVCGVASSTSKRAMHCELPPGHYEFDHRGRDVKGEWRTWFPKPKRKTYSDALKLLQVVRLR